MEKADLYRALTLWFVVLIYIAVGSETSLLMRAAGMVAIALAYLIPGVLFVDLVYAYTSD